MMIAIKLFSEVDDAVQTADGFFDGWPNYPDQQVHRMIMKNSYKTIVAVDTATNLIIGFINIISDGVFSAYIPLLEVVAAYQHRGIGKKLMEKAIEETKDLYMLDVCCDDRVRTFYEKFNMCQVNGMILRNYENQKGKNAP